MRLTTSTSISLGGICVLFGGGGQLRHKHSVLAWVNRRAWCEVLEN